VSYFKEDVGHVVRMGKVRSTYESFSRKIENLKKNVIDLDTDGRTLNVKTQISHECVDWI
jgi:hypothetical protein